MLPFRSARSIFGFLSKQTLGKYLLANANQRFDLLHSTRILWNGHPIEIKMPSLSPTMTEGTIVKWLKKEGDTISPGDVLCEIQTDKAVVGLETEEEGVLEKILVPEDTKNVQLGEIIAIIMGEGEATGSSDSLPPAIPDKTSETKKPTEEIKADPNRLVGPSVKKLLEEYGITFSDVPSTGPRHNLLKGDVLSFIKKNNLKLAPKIAEKLKHKKLESPSPAVKGTHVDIPVSSEISKSAQEMIHSKTTIPHGYMSADCKIDRIFEYNKTFQKDGVEISLNGFIVKSTVTALKRVPKMNIFREGGKLKSPDVINILLTDFKDGHSQTSVIKNAGNLNIQSISEQIKASLSEESNLQCANKFRILALSELGISEFSEVISPTDVAILTVGGVRHVFENEKPVKKICVTLSFDSCLVTENEAGEFLENFKNCLENPLNIIC